MKQEFEKIITKLFALFITVMALTVIACKPEVETKIEYVDKIVYVDKTYAKPVTFTSTANNDGSVTVTMATETEGASIYYTIDGSKPTTRSNIYTQAISFNLNTTIKAFAVKEGIEPSPVSVASVSINEKTITEIQIEYVDKKADEIAPADVTNLTATAKDKQILQLDRCRRR